MKKRVLIAVFVLIALLAGLSFVLRERLASWFFRPTKSFIEVGLEKVEEDPEIQFGVRAQNLDTPWSIAVRLIVPSLSFVRNIE